MWWIKKKAFDVSYQITGCLLVSCRIAKSLSSFSYGEKTQLGALCFIALGFGSLQTYMQIFIGLKLCNNSKKCQGWRL